MVVPPPSDSPGTGYSPPARKVASCPESADHALAFESLKKDCELKTADRTADAEAAGHARAYFNREGEPLTDQGAGFGPELAAVSHCNRRAKAFRYAAVHFREADLQHDLLRSAHHHEVRYPVGGVAVCQVEGPVKFGGRGHLARQHDAVVRGADLDLLARKDLLQPFLELGDVGRDVHVDVRDQLSLW
jgi:hypothetical protein